MVPTSKAFFTVLFLSLALCQITAAEPSLKDSLAEKILGAIKEMTTLSSNLRLQTQKINVANARDLGGLIPQGFAGIITKVSEATSAISSATNVHASPLSDDDAKLVVANLTTFVQVHRQLLYEVIDKHGLPSLSPFFEPIRLSLDKLGEVVGSFANALIDLIPTQEVAANMQFNSLTDTIDTAYGVYLTSLSHGDSPAVESIQAAFKDITKLSDDLRLETLKINIVNAPLVGFKAALGFSGIIEKVNQVIAQLAGVNGGISPLSDDDAKLVVKSLTTFVQVHQALLNVVIGKHGIVTLVPFFEPIRLSLVSLEATVDTFAFYLIGLIPTQKPAADTQFRSLGITVKLAEDTYSTPLTAYV